MISSKDLGAPQYNSFTEAILWFIQFLPNMLANDSTSTGRSMLYSTNTDAPNNMMQPGDLVRYAIRYPGQIDNVMRWMRAWGFDAKPAKALLDIYRTILAPDDIVKLGFREGWKDSTIRNKLSTAGIHQRDLDNYINARKVYPGIQDIIKFAVREVYTPNIRATFKLDEDLPQQLLDESKKIGLPEKEAKDYWASHWELPGIQQTYAMFHRTTAKSSDPNADKIPLPSGKYVENVVGYKTLQQLLKAADVMPFWRDKLTQVAYQPLTRVDVRRMYSLNVLDIDDVYRSYLDLGYAPHNADAMTRFTVKYENKEFDGITRSNITKAYKDGIINEEQMGQYFDGLRMSKTVKTFYMRQAIYDRTEAEIKARVKDLIELYRIGDYNSETVRLELNKLDLPDTYITKIINDMVRDKAVKRQVPPKSDLINWLKRNIITEFTFFEKMSLLGYKDEDIYYYLTEIALDLDTSKREYLGVKTYQRWLKSKIITVEYFTTTLREMEVSDKDISKLIVEVRLQQDANNK